MKRIIIAAVIALTATAAYASCTYYTIMQNGRMVSCTQCCYGNSCTTTCY